MNSALGFANYSFKKLMYNVYIKYIANFAFITFHCQKSIKEQKFVHRL